MNPIVRDAIENGLNIPLQEVRSIQSLSNGCINEVCKVEFESKHSVVIKSNRSNLSRSMFEAESDGLERIRQSRMIRVPEVVKVSPTNSQGGYLILEFVESVPKNIEFWQSFGEQLAQLHSVQGETRFGFEDSNFIGSTIQPNTWAVSWIEFFSHQRLAPMHKKLRDAGYLDTQISKSLELFNRSLDRFICEPSHPSIVHGDLWNGNFICSNIGCVYLIDPSVSWSDREFEFGIMRMFGGFPERFYEAYNAVYPIASGWEDRALIYQLYHGLNHWLLFGPSYAAECQTILDRFT